MAATNAELNQGGAAQCQAAAALARAAEHLAHTGRTLVTLSYAQSLDGSLALRRGEPLALSGPAALRMTHRLRAAHQAILVGVGTVLSDDPQLNVRLAEGPVPQAIVLDSGLRTPSGARLLRRPAWIFCRADANPARRAALQAAGAEVLALPAAPDGRLSLPHLLECLAGRGVASLMVEGGAAVLTSFLSQALADQVVITLAPRLVGGLRAFGAEAGAPTDAPSRRLVDVAYERLEDDLVVAARLVYAGL